PAEAIPMGNRLTGMVIRSGKPLLVDARQYERMVRSHAVHASGHPPQSWLGVPLISEGRAIGAMVVQSYTDPHAYGPEALSVMTFVSTEVARAIEFKRTQDHARIQQERYRLAISHAGAV